jgi:hypothetical protein
MAAAMLVNQNHELTRAESPISIAFHADRRWDLRRFTTSASRILISFF